MKPIKLFIENFYCHKKSEVDFSNINSAIIVGRIDGNDLYSNGVGKTTIFKAIDYVLFNYSSVNLEKLIFEGEKFCKITFDFSIDDKIYRIVRSRTKKNSISDLSFYERSGLASDNAHVLYTDTSLWDNKTCRRSSDTEKEIFNLLKITQKAFASTVHFAQNDMSGLATATPEKRKQILKEALHLSLYSKLEKLSKDKYNALLKEYDKNSAIIDSFGNCDEANVSLTTELSAVNMHLLKLDDTINVKNSYLQEEKLKLSELNSNIYNLKSNQINIKKTISSIENDNIKISKNIETLKSKKALVSASAKDLVIKIKSLKDQKSKIDAKELSAQLESLNHKLELINQSISDKDARLSNNNVKLIDFKKQLQFFIENDSAGQCKYCLSDLSPEHKESCKEDIKNNINQTDLEQTQLKTEKTNLLSERESIRKNISSNISNKDLLSKIENEISLYESKYFDNKKLYDEYVANLSNENNLLFESNTKLYEAKVELSNLDSSKLTELEENIQKASQKIITLESSVIDINEQISSLKQRRAVIDHSIKQNLENATKIKDLLSLNKELSNKIAIYPSVIDAFGSGGIPSLIIQNVLDDLQNEANTLLNQLRPGLQLSFQIEKTRDDGVQDETLDIKYFLNGKEREYEQLSGAMKLVSVFSLKLGLSFLLQKTMGADIKMLLLDEIDQSLDKAGVDAFFDIIKFFQKDYTILVITHNDRLKDKFQNQIVVEQDTSGVSTIQLLGN